MAYSKAMYKKNERKLLKREMENILKNRTRSYTNECKEKFVSLVKKQQDFVVKQLEWVLDGSYGAGAFVIYNEKVKNNDLNNDKELKRITLDMFEIYCVLEFHLTKRQVRNTLKSILTTQEIEKFIEKLMNALKEHAEFFSERE